jgi:glycosyltransferase involved in cell wall biosynthesis
VITRATRHASAIVVPTAAVAAELTRHAPGPARVHVVGHGVSGVVLRLPEREVADRIADRLRLPENYVLAVGTVEPRKGLDVLVEAMARPTAPTLPLVIAGPSGWGAVDLAAIAAEQGLPPGRLHLLGRLSDAELSVVLHRATVLAVPSLAEGFGLPLLEAMAAGVPVVHSDVPALLEVAGGTGVLARRGDPAALANALRCVVALPEHTATRVEAARARASKFTWERAAESLWKLHVELYHAARVGSV